MLGRTGLFLPWDTRSVISGRRARRGLSQDHHATLAELLRAALEPHGRRSPGRAEPSRMEIPAVCRMNATRTRVPSPESPNGVGCTVPHPSKTIQRHNPKKRCEIASGPGPAWATIKKSPPQSRTRPTSVSISSVENADRCGRHAGSLVSSASGFAITRMPQSAIVSAGNSASNPDTSKPLPRARSAKWR